MTPDQLVRVVRAAAVGDADAELDVDQAVAGVHGRLERAQDVDEARALNQKERHRMTETLTARGFVVTPSQANFVLVNLARPARPVYDALLQKGVIVRPFPSLPTSLRVTLGTERENDRFLTALAEVLS